MKNHITKHAHIYEKVTYIIQLLVGVCFFVSVFISPFWVSLLFLVIAFKLYVLRLVYIGFIAQKIKELLNKNPLDVLKTLPLTGRQRRNIRRKLERDGVLKKIVDDVINKD